jgi:hypothetical protein
MAIHKPSIDRPPVRKKFLTARNVEDIAASGVAEIVQTSDLIITDAARETAIDLNIKIVAFSEQLKKSKGDDILTPLTLQAHSTNETSSPQKLAAVMESPSVRKTSSLGDRKAYGGVQGGQTEQPVISELVALIRKTWKPAKKQSRKLLTSKKC